MKLKPGRLVAILAVCACGGLLLTRAGADAPKSNDAPADIHARRVERGRKTIQMLDDIYKSAIVLITDKYVHTDDDLPAGTAFKALFTAVKKKGWHEIRLLDGTGEPIEAVNVPRDEFEKTAMKEILGGKAYYEQVVEIEGKPFLRAATSLPVVMEKCIMCHPNYEDVKTGQAIGALSYTLPLQ
jgi:hypothetical protein